MNNTAIRLCGGTALGALFGILCFYGFASQPDMTPALKKLATWSTSNFLMWEMIVNRAMIGFLVGLAGFMTVHPLFGFKFPSVLRGFVMGIFGTLTMSFGVLTLVMSRYTNLILFSDMKTPPRKAALLTLQIENATLFNAA